MIPHVLRMLEGTFSLSAAHISLGIHPKRRAEYTMSGRVIRKYQQNCVTPWKKSVFGSYASNLVPKQKARRRFLIRAFHYPFTEFLRSVKYINIFSKIQIHRLIWILSTPQPLYNTVVGVHSLNRVS